MKATFFTVVLLITLFSGYAQTNKTDKNAHTLEQEKKQSLLLLYHKEKLSDLENFDPNSTNPVHWGIHPKIWNEINKNDLFKKTKQDIIALQNHYKIASNTNMSQDKRITIYHNILIEWKKKKNTLTDINKQNIDTIEIKENTKERSDKEIFDDVIKKSNLFKN